MALAFQVLYTFVDDSGETATTAINVPTTFSIAQYTEFARAMAALVDDVVHGVVQSAELILGVDISGIDASTDTDSDVEEIGSFQFATVDGRKVNVNVPTIREDVVLAGSDNLDLADTDVAAFITAMVDGIAVTSGTIVPCDVNEDDLADIVFAREAFRSSGKRR